MLCNEREKGRTCKRNLRAEEFTGLRIDLRKGEPDLRRSQAAVRLKTVILMSSRGETALWRKSSFGADVVKGYTCFLAKVSCLCPLGPMPKLY